MSNIQMYLEPDDVNIILEWLNCDSEIAFFKPNGPNKWIAVKTIDKLLEQNLLWHTPYRDLPLEKAYPLEPDLIDDPWSGWEEIRINQNTVPYFGTGCPGIIELDININRYCLDQNDKPVDIITRSFFGWIGNYYSRLGRPALKETEIWWKNLRKKIKKETQEMKFIFEDEFSKRQLQTTIYAFPNAFEAIKNGKEFLYQSRVLETYKK